MAQTHDSPLLSCHLNIIRLTNSDLDLSGNLFVRYYVFAGDGRRIKIDTREVRCTSELCWNELATLECRGGVDPLGELLRPRSVVFELRWRRSTPVLARITRSKLLGRGEVAWKDVIGSADMSLERRIVFGAMSCVPVGCKPPALLVRMKVGVSAPAKKRRAWKECDCKDCKWNGSQEDVLATAWL